MTTVKARKNNCASLNEDLFQENIMKIVYRFILGILGFCLSGAGLAAGDLPAAQTFAGVSYITGGIGDNESAAIKAAEKDFSLSLVFAQTKRGEFVADVKVSIKDKAGKLVLEAVSDGPMLLARLPAGAYTVSADYGGKVLSRTVRVDGKGLTRAGFVWQPTAKATME